MTISLFCLTLALNAPPETADTSANKTMDEIPMPPEPIDVDRQLEEVLPEEAKELDKDMERSRERLAREHEHKQAGPAPDHDHDHDLLRHRYGDRDVPPGEKSETKDWADQARWQRYKKGDEAAGVRKKRPDFLRQRRPALAFALGAVIGFGVGHYYAGEPLAGMIFSGIDAALVIGFVAATVALNRLVIKHDFRSGDSLARGERDFGKRESRLYATSVVLALATVGSHIWQGVASLRAARRTNRTLGALSFAPVPGGGALQLRVDF